MKKQAIIAGAAALALAVTGCGRADSGGGAAQTAAPTVNTSSVSGNLTVWAMGAEAEKLGTLTKKFEAANPGVKVSVTAIPWSSAHDKFVSAVSSGEVPDVAQVGTTWMGEFGNDLDPVPAMIDSAKFFEGAQKTAVFEGANVGVPWYVETRTVYYNKKVAKKAGVTAEPTNWDEFAAMVKAMKDSGGAKYGISLQPGGEGSWQTVLPFMWSNGGNIMSDDAQTFTFDDPKNAEALAYYQKFFTDGLANKAPVGDTLVSDFSSGKVPMFISGPWMMSAVEETGKMSKEDYGVFKMPAKVSGTSFVGGANLAVFKKTQNRDAAWKLVDYLTQAQTQIDWYKETASLPSVTAAWDDAAMKEDPYLTVFGEQLKDAKAPASIASWTQVAAAFDSAVEKVTKAGDDPAAQLKDVQTKAQSIGVG